MNLDLSLSLSRITLAELDAKAGRLGEGGRRHVVPLKRVVLLTSDGRRRVRQVRRTPEEATKGFWMRVTIGQPEECWEWQARRSHENYGQVGVQTANRQHQMPAHRVAYWMLNGDFDSSAKVLHKCDNPPCCNPRHLFTGTPRDNILDCIRKERYPGARLKANQVLEIRMKLAEGATRLELAELFGVSIYTIRSIDSGETWSFLNHN